MDFLKNVFGDKALTLDELTKALETNKIKIGNLSDGGYIGKEKFDAEETKAKSLQAQLEELNKSVEQLKIEVSCS